MADDSKLAQQNDDVIRPDKNPSEAGIKKVVKGKILATKFS